MKAHFKILDKKNTLNLNDHIFAQTKINVPDGKIPLTLNFTDEVIGECEVIATPGSLEAVADIDDKFITLFPACGVSIVESHFKGNVTIIDRCTVREVSLCSNPNVDPEIKRISQQIAEKE